MKKSLLLSVLFALCSLGPTRLWADPADRFLEAYFLIQEGDSAERQGAWVKANTKFNSALEILRELKTESPDWNPHIVDFRTKYIEDHLARIRPKLELPPPPPQPAPVPEAPPAAPPTETPAQPPATQPAEAPAPPTETPAPPAEAPVPSAETPATPTETPPAETPTAPPAAENEQVTQLTAELQRAREQVRELEAARDDLNAKLQEQLSKVEAKQTTPQIEELLRTNQELAAKLAAAQTEMAQMRERPAPAAPETAVPAAESDVIQNLRAQLTESRGELQRTKEELQAARLELGSAKQELEKAQTDNVELRRSYEDIVAQLTEANKRLLATRAASEKDDEIIRQLRKENALLRVIAERKAGTSPGESDGAEAGRAIPELRGWRPRPRTESTAKSSPPPGTEESSPEKLVATLTAPKKTGTNEPLSETSVPAPAPAKSSPPPAPKPVPPQPATPPPKPAPSTTATTPPKPAFVKPPIPPPRPQTAAKATPPPQPRPAPAPKPAPVAKPPPQTPPKAPAPAAKAPAQTPTTEPAPPAQPAPKPKELPPPPPDVRNLLNEARAALALKDLNTAATKYETVLKIDPENLTALSNLGAICYQQSRYDDAEFSLRKVIAVTPNDSNARALLGIIYFRRGLVEEAFSELNRATVIDPRNPDAHNYLGIVLNEKGWATAGEQQIRRALELNPQYADAHFNLAVIYAKQRTPKVELARYHYRKALDLGAPPDGELEMLLKKLSAKATEPQPEGTP